MRTQLQEPVCVWKIQADGEGKEKKAVEPCIEQVILGNDMVKEEKKQKVESFCRRTVQFDKAADYGKAQKTEPLSKELVFAPDPVTNGESQACEGTVPGTENVQEPEQWQQTQPLFHLLDEEDDLEGVELGEEEIGEDF